MKREYLDRCIGQLDGMIATFGQAVVLSGRTQKESEGCELLKDARLKLIEDLEGKESFSESLRIVSSKCNYPECSTISVNACHDCDVEMCANHSYLVISDDEKQVFVCPGCYFDGYSENGP